MTSYKIIPVPQDELDLEDVEEKVENLSIREDVSEFKRGTLPESFGQVSDEVFWFRYGIQEEFEYNQLDDTGTVKRLEEYAIAFLGNGFIAVENSDNDTRDELLSIIEHQFTNDISLETTRFSEMALRGIIEDASETIQAYITPKERSQPEQVSGTDRHLPDTDFWDRYGDEPLRKIKVNVDGEEKEVRVGFDEYGVVILYEQSLTLPEEVEALKFLAGTLLSRLIDTGNYQSTLSRDNTGDEETM